MFFENRNLHLERRAFELVETGLPNGHNARVGGNFVQVCHLRVTLLGIPWVDAAGKGMSVVRVFGYFKFKWVYVEDARVIRVIVFLEKNLVSVKVVKFHTLIVLCLRLAFSVLWLRNRIIT